VRAKALALMIELAAGGAAPAQEARQADPVCPRDAAPIPQELKGWSPGSSLASATRGAGPTIVIGKAYDVVLHPDARLHLPNLPGPVKDRVGRGGTMSFSVAEAGTYHVALGYGVWVDIVRGGKALESVAHGHGPACSGIAKLVDFQLTPGRYTLTLDGSETRRTSVLVALIPRSVPNK
jgi:hypothetical protein